MEQGAVRRSQGLAKGQRIDERHQLDLQMFSTPERLRSSGSASASCGFDHVQSRRSFERAGEGEKLQLWNIARASAGEVFDGTQPDIRAMKCSLSPQQSAGRGSGRGEFKLKTSSPRPSPPAFARKRGRCEHHASAECFIISDVVFSCAQLYVVRDNQLADTASIEELKALAVETSALTQSLINSFSKRRRN
jgi:hypothetical protein